MQLGFELFKHLVHDADGILVRERPVVGAKLQTECDALLARLDADAAVDIEEVDLPQELACGGGDAALQLADGEAFVADERQIARDGGGLGQRMEHALTALLWSRVKSSSAA